MLPKDTNTIAVLTVDLAKALIDKYDGELELNGIETLTDDAGDALEVLARYDGEAIHLNGLKIMATRAATALANYKGDLAFAKLPSLTPDAAEALAKHKGYLYLDGLVCRGGLHLNGLRVLSEECAEALAAHSGGYLELNGIAVLSERAAQLLATYKCPRGYRPPGLSLTGLTSIPATPGHLALARLLSGHDGVLFLKCLTSLEDEAAEVLASHTGPLCLDSLTTLSDKAAEALARHKGDLSLQGIVALSDSAAASLARHEGYLKLAGVTFLADAAAGHLARHNGLLSLVAVEQLHETPGHILRGASNS